MAARPTRAKADAVANMIFPASDAAVDGAHSFALPTSAIAMVMFLARVGVISYMCLNLCALPSPKSAALPTRLAVVAPVVEVS